MDPAPSPPARGVATFFLAPDHRLRSGWRFLIALLASIAVLFVTGAIAFAADRSAGTRYTLLSSSLAVLFLLLLYWLLGRILDRDPHAIATMGLGIDRPVARQFIAGVLLGFFMICAALAWIMAAGRLSLAWHWTSATWTPFLIITFTLLAAALNEELVFRGYPFQRLLEATGPVISITLLAVLFGLAHWGNPHSTWLGITNTALVGVLFGVALVRTRSLWFCWALHFSWNFSLGVIFGLPVSGLNKFSVLGFGSAQGPDWLTGGAYGIEAGLSGTAAILLGLLVTLLITRGTWLRGTLHAAPPSVPPNVTSPQAIPPR